MKSLTFAVASANLAAMVAGHGLITSPTPRPAGDALAAACGQQAYYMRTSDPAGNVQGELQVEGSGSGYDATACHVWLCAGHQFADNSAANIQSYTAGQTVAMKFEIKAPHTGVANVSIVDTATGLAIGDPLISWSDFADNSVPTQADQESFSITIPTDLGDACSTAGACVIQHYWNAASIDQTYESCVDFTVSGSGSSGSSSSSAVVASSTVAASSSSTEASTSIIAVSSSVTAVSTVATSTSSSTDVTVTVSPVPVSSSVTSVAAVPTSASTSSSTKKSCTYKASSTAATSTAVTISSAIGVDSTTTSVATTLATSAATTAVTTSATAATATTSATATSTGTSTTGSLGNATIEELIDLIIDLLEALLGTSSTTKKMKRSHARDVRSIL